MGVWYDYVGIARPVRGVFTDVRGLWPGVFMLDFSPQPSLPAIIGALTLMDGNGGVVTIPNCKVDVATVVVTSNGHVEHIRGFDPRWTWEFGEITGVYNLRNPDGTVDSGSERTPQELATLLFAAMGVPECDVSALPNASRPYVNWRAATPRPHLQQLLDALGCTVVMNWSTLRPVVVRLGVGAGLPGGAIQTNSFGVDLAEAPSAVKLYCARDVHQTKFRLRMVLPKSDGGWVWWDEAPYAPEGGWSVTDPSDPLPDGEDPELSLAKRWWGKAYRIESAADGTLEIPGLEAPLVSLEQVLPLRDGLAQSYTSPDGREAPLPAVVEGIYWLGSVIDDEIEPAENSEPFTPIADGWTIDKETGVVRFSKRLVRLTDEGTFEPAKLYLTISHHVWDVTVGAYRAYAQLRPLSPSPAGVRAEEVDYMGRQYIGEYKGEELTGVSDNVDWLVEAASALLDALAQQYQPSASLSRQYAGIVPVQLDGLRTQATYRVHCRDGANTWAHLNTEAEPGVPRLRDLRRLAAVQRMRRLRHLTRDEAETT